MQVTPALRTLIIGSAIAGAFALGAAFGHLKPWQIRMSAEDQDILAGIKEHSIWEVTMPRVLARCVAAGIAVPVLPSDPHDENGDRRSYVMACMRGEGFEYDILAETRVGEKCDDRGYHGDYENERCYRPVGLSGRGPYR